MVYDSLTGAPDTLITQTMDNHADHVYLQRQFWAKTANTYLNSSAPDPAYLIKLLNTAAKWEQEWQDHLRHVGAFRA